MAKATARHILVKQAKLAAKIKKEILSGELTFEKAAKKYSRCSSKKSNGNLGTFSKGEMVKEFDEVVFKEEVNRLHGPVKTQFGYHLIEITSRY
ncbi:MAG: peptidylprolyl isomerase [Campylobacteraceae bacterium]|nr:peptidylprolyl isomerase [Campylobacteraceae bacterium]